MILNPYFKGYCSSTSKQNLGNRKVTFEAKNGLKRCLGFFFGHFLLMLLSLFSALFCARLLLPDSSCGSVRLFRKGVVCFSYWNPREPREAREPRDENAENRERRILKERQKNRKTMPIKKREGDRDRDRERERERETDRLRERERERERDSQLQNAVLKKATYPLHLSCIGNWRNTASRVLFWRRELTEPSPSRRLLLVVAD